jgi:predicted hotdog family 3-hydroxylacyl-ACP dehydratase
MGVLASVRDVQLFVARLDDIEADLICEATHCAAGAGAALYEFIVRTAERQLLCGRATLVIDALARVLDMGEAAGQ